MFTQECGYGGFVLFEGVAYYRSDPAEDLVMHRMDAADGPDGLPSVCMSEDTRNRASSKGCAKHDETVHFAPPVDAASHSAKVQNFKHDQMSDLVSAPCVFFFSKPSSWPIARVWSCMSKKRHRNRHVKNSCRAFSLSLLVMNHVASAEGEFAAKNKSTDCIP